MAIQSSRLILAAMLASAVFTVCSQACPACEICCSLCGKAEATEKVCRLVPVEKKITITCWGCEAEDICLPGPSKPVCRHCDVACDEDGVSCCHHPGLFRKYFVWAEWEPCARSWSPCSRPRIVTKKRLMKKTVTKTIPSYKWVVEELCPECEQACETVAIPDGVLIPPPPDTDARVLTSQPTPAVERR